MYVLHVRAQVRFEKNLNPEDFAQELKQKNIVLGGISMGFRSKTQASGATHHDTEKEEGQTMDSEAFFEFVDFVEVSKKGRSCV